MQKVFEELKQLLNNCYAPYSKYQVASIVETNIGNFQGVNVECGAYGCTICAEQSAIVNAISNGAKQFKKIYLLTTSTDCFGMPCGQCRQVISEHFDSNCQLVVFNLEGKYQIYKIKKILPLAWSPSTLFNQKNRS